jgi:cation transport ATPase
MIDADEDVDIKAGRNITLDSGSGRILLKANKADCDALTGNLTPKNTNWGAQVFAGTFVGSDVLDVAFNPSVTSLIGL